MNKMQMIEMLEKTITELHNAMDEILDIEDNVVATQQAARYIVRAERNINDLIDEIDDQLIIEGSKSGAV